MLDSKRMKPEALRQFDQNKMKNKKQTHWDSDESPKKSNWFSPPSSASTNEESYNVVECSSAYWELADTKYCLENSDNKEKLKSRLSVTEASKNQQRVKDIFIAQGGNIIKVIDSLKCTLCHDMLGEEPKQCNIWSQSFCVDCLTRSEIEKDTICPNSWANAVRYEVSSEIKFLLTWLRIKCEHHIRGCNFDSNCLRDLNFHEKSCDFDYKTCQYCNDKTVIKKLWGDHILKDCKAIQKCQAWPECKFMGLEDEVEKHEDDDCGFTEISCYTCKSDILRKDKLSHDWIGKLKDTLSQKETSLHQVSDKLTKMNNDNERLRDLLVTMKKTLLEKLEYEKKLKIEITKIKKNYPSIKPPKRARTQVDVNDTVSHKRKKTDETDAEKTFKTFEKEIDKSISQRNYHSKFVVWWCPNQEFSEEMPNWIKTGDWFQWKGTLWKDCHNQCDKWSRPFWPNWFIECTKCSTLRCIKCKWCK